MKKTIQGVGIALVTPFDSHNRVDYAALKRILDHTAQYADFWVVHGTTGEAATTTREEKHLIFDFIAQNNPRNLPLVYGLAWNDTQQLLELLKKNDYSRVDAFLSAAPAYNKPSQEGLFRHYQALADAAPAPVILYNVPSRTACNIQAQTTLRLAQHPNIIGIKEASNDLGQCLDILREKPQDFELLSGDDALTIPLISIGATGVIGVLPNAMPKAFYEMTHLALAGKFAQAAGILHRVAPILPLLFQEGNPTGIKALLHGLGLSSPYVRLPLIEASESLIDALVATYNQIEVQSVEP
jgi:4-hydroxy-tetrahydrodipicolinate synthase